MNGLLHRLAARAMGSTSTLRSSARLPYAAPPSLVSDKQVAMPGIAENEQRPAVSNGAKWGRELVHEQHRANLHAKIGAGENEVTTPSPELLVEHTELSAKPGRHYAQSSTKKAMVRQPNASGIKSVAGESPSEGFETNIPVNNSKSGAIDIPVLAAVFESNRQRNDSPVEAIAHDKQSSTHLDSGSPQPLLPLKNSARPSALNAGASAQRGEPGDSVWQGQVEETIEVHVSIGRIEVTAVHEAPPLKRQAPTTARPMSLDEYLARRQGET